MVEALQPPQEIVQQLHGKGSQTELEYRLAWARTYLKKLILVTNSERGVWALTSEGSNIQSVDPRHVVRFVQQQSRQSSQPALLTDDSLSDTFEEVEDATEEMASWRQTLLETLLNMSPPAFECLCQRLLRESGFIEVEITGRSGDGGIDGHGIIRLAGC